jgi:hypothetical protein
MIEATCNQIVHGETNHDDTVHGVAVDDVAFSDVAVDNNTVREGFEICGCTM